MVSDIEARMPYTELTEWVQYYDDLATRQSGGRGIGKATTKRGTRPMNPNTPEFEKLFVGWAKADQAFKDSGRRGKGNGEER